MPYAHGGLCPMPYARRNMLLRKAIDFLSLNSITKQDSGAEVELTP